MLLVCILESLISFEFLYCTMQLWIPKVDLRWLASKGFIFCWWWRWWWFMMWHVQEVCSLWTLFEMFCTLVEQPCATMFGLFAGQALCMLLKLEPATAVFHYSGNFFWIPAVKWALLDDSSHQQTSSGQKRRHWLVRCVWWLSCQKLEPPFD